MLLLIQIVSGVDKDCDGDDDPDDSDDDHHHDSVEDHM